MQPEPLADRLTRSGQQAAACYPTVSSVRIERTLKLGGTYAMTMVARELAAAARSPTARQVARLGR
jgi:hypothetical protein